MNKNIYHLFISIFFLIIYRLGSFSKITFGDAMAKVLDVEVNKFSLETFSTTHFLFQNFSVLLYKILKIVDAIEILRWISIVSAVIVLNILFLLLKKITNKNWISLLGTVVFGFSFTFWKNTENLEVYTFSLIWVSLYCLYAIEYIKNGKSKILLTSSIILGVSLYCHIQSILLFPSYFYLIYLALKKDNKNIYYLVIPFIFLASLYVYPIVNGLSTKNVLSSSSSTWVSDSLEKGIIDYIKDLVKAIGYIIYNFWGFSLFLFFIPFKEFIRNRTLIFLIILGLPVFGFSTIYAVSDNYVFFLNFNLSYLIILTIGLDYFILKYSKYQLIVSLLIFITPFYYYISKEIAFQTEFGKEFHKKKAYKDGLNYYLLPWMNNNKGILETIIDKVPLDNDSLWMESAAEEYIKIKSKTMSMEEIKEL